MALSDLEVQATASLGCWWGFAARTAVSAAWIDANAPDTVTGAVNLATREVQWRALSDPEIYELEMDRIFGRIWNLLGHESEIPNSGDFMVRCTGSDSVLINRDKDGQVHVALNVCPHRGMCISVVDAGNPQVHTCIHHDWAFRPNGAFPGAPVERETMHGKMMSKEQLAPTGRPLASSPPPMAFIH